MYAYATSYIKKLANYISLHILYHNPLNFDATHEPCFPVNENKSSC